MRGGQRIHDIKDGTLYLSFNFVAVDIESCAINFGL